MDAPFLGVNLRFYREFLQLSQQEFAERAGPPFSQTLISRLERGLRPSDPRHVEVLTAALGITPTALLRRPRVVRRISALSPVVVAEDATSAATTPTTTQGKEER